MNPYDAAALFWYARNRIYFDLRCGERDDVHLVRYEDFVSQPENVIRHIYDFVDMEAPRSAALSQVRTSSIGKGCDIDLSTPITALCDSLFDDLVAEIEVRR